MVLVTKVGCMSKRQGRWPLGQVPVSGEPVINIVQWEQWGCNGAATEKAAGEEAAGGAVEYFYFNLIETSTKNQCCWLVIIHSSLGAKELGAYGCAPGWAPGWAVRVRRRVGCVIGQPFICFITTFTQLSRNLWLLSRCQTFSLRLLLHTLLTQTRLL